QPLITSALKADERIVNYLKGLNYLDDRLAPLVAPVVADTTPLPPSQQGVVEIIVQQLRQSGGLAPLPIYQLLGPDSQSKLSVAAYVVESLGMTLYRLAADTIPAQTGDNETYVRLWQRESALLPIALYIDASEIDRRGSPHVAPIQRLANR